MVFAALERMRALAMKRFGPRVFWSLLATGLLAAVGLLFEQWVTEQLLPSIWIGLRSLAGRSVGLFGLLLFVELALLLLLCFVDTSPVVEWLRTRGGGRRQRVSLEDQAEIDRIREMWVGSPRDSCELAKRALQGCSYHLKAHNGLSGLLWLPLNNLTKALQEFEAALSPNSREPFSEVHSRLRALLDTYGVCILWYNRCRRVDDSIPPEQSDYFNRQTHVLWAKHHVAFMKDLRKLSHRAAYNGRGHPGFAERLSAVKSIDDPPMPRDLASLDEGEVYPQQLTLGDTVA